MSHDTTEAVHADAIGLDALPFDTLAAQLCTAQLAATHAVAAASCNIARAGTAMAQTIQNGGRLFYAAAGSSALMALADACELTGTFGLNPDQIRILMAGGLPTSAAMPGSTEDDVAAAREAADGITENDTVILISASGSTPYPLEIARIAQAKGARTICIANNSGAPLFDHATVAICLETPPELIAGSTRLGAGTAQKVALNAMSTIMGIALGHVHDGMMVNLIADNEKLRQRAAGMVSKIASVPAATAQTCLTRANGAVKPAVLLAAGAQDLTEAEARLTRTKGHLRAALAEMTCRA